MKRIKKINLGAWLRAAKALLFLVVLASLMATAASPVQGSANPPAPQTPEGGTAVWNIQTVDGPPFYFFMTDRNLRIRPSDHVPCVAYGGDHLYYSCYDKVSDTWTQTLVDNGLMVGSFAALAFNNQSHPFITYYDGYNGYLKLAFNLGFGWNVLAVDVPTPAPPPPTSLETPEATDTPAETTATKPTWLDQLLATFPTLHIYAPGYINGIQGVGKHSSIDIDSNNQLHISYYDEQHGALKYAFWDGFHPIAIETVEDYNDQGDTGLWTSIRADSFLRPQISYMDEKYDDLKYAIKKGNTWDIFQVDNGVNVGPFSSLAVDSTNHPHIAYLFFNYGMGRFNLRYAKLNADNVSWTKSYIDQSPDVGLFASLVIDSSGHLHASYYDLQNGNLRYATSSNGTTWTVQVRATKGDVGFYTSIDMLPSDKPAISYFDASLGAMKFIYKEGNSWINAEEIGFSANVGLATSLAISSLGVPHISYINETLGLLKYARAHGPLWTTSVISDTAFAGAYPPLDIPFIGTFNSIDLQADFNPLVAFYQYKKGDLYLASLDSSHWDLDRIDRYDDVGQHVSLVVGQDGLPHISYLDSTWGLLNYATWDPAASDWVTDTVDYFDVGGYTSIALGEPDIFGRRLPAISYFDSTNEQIRYAYLTLFLSWQNIPIASVGDPNDTEPVLEAYTSLDFDSLGNPHIAFYDETLGDLRYAHYNGTTWVLETLDSTGDVGKFASLAIDRNTDQRHICYYDATNHDLKYAFWNGAAWSTEIVDALGDQGMYCSIDLNGAGLPGISYYDASSADLKFASTYTLPPDMIFLPAVFHP